jgi:hypothetical protein
MVQAPRINRVLSPSLSVLEPAPLQQGKPELACKYTSDQQMLNGLVLLVA